MMESRSSHSGRHLPARRRGRLTAAALLAVLAVAAAGRAGLVPPRPGTGAAAAQLSRLRQIVVLPFANISRDPEDQILADGLVETLTSSLTQLERFQRTLRVVPATEVRSARLDQCARGAAGLRRHPRDHRIGAAWDRRRCG